RKAGQGGSGEVRGERAERSEVVIVVELERIDRRRDAQLLIGAVRRDAVGDREEARSGRRGPDGVEVGIVRRIDGTLHRARQGVRRGGRVVRLLLAGAAGHLVADPPAGTDGAFAVAGVLFGSSSRAQRFTSSRKPLPALPATASSTRT